MKVAIIDPVGNKAGIDHYDIQLLNGMKSAGATCFLFSNFDCTEENIEYKKIFFNVNVNKLSAILSNIKGFFLSLLICKRKNIDHVILHVFRAGVFDLITFAVTKFLGIKIIAIIHDIESLDTLTLPWVRKTVIGRLPWKRVVHNRFSKDELRKSIGSLIDKETYTIPHVNFSKIFDYKKSNTAPLTLPKELMDAIEKKEQIILFFGQIKKPKGLKVLIQSLVNCKSKFKLVIAGKLRNENWDEYTQLIHDNGVSDKIIPIIRHITDEERDFLFDRCNAIVLPYIKIYQSGVLLMAMSFPIAPIVSNLSPNTDLVVDGLTGYIFESENEIDLAKKIDQCLSNNELTISIAENAKTSMLIKNTPEVIGEKFVGLIR